MLQADSVHWLLERVGDPVVIESQRRFYSIAWATEISNQTECFSREINRKGLNGNELPTDLRVDEMTFRVAFSQLIRI